ncbi:ABC transporter substrate-binding protein [Actinoplanes sp. NEAU-A12]|uniref:ABC transporter substrate-binding protein n=1 Tax=Actinoplanes sandaracinus TaxID=3045177 RepID=A0ABT6WIR8_9ACTN|nr:ABC transporter substrate-binding protein [Actinoplanes sandaracinus]MDI6099560.1 ABC transporter substrate-binding protein [Actinoplanes sandaracinus]
MIRLRLPALLALLAAALGAAAPASGAAPGGGTLTVLYSSTDMIFDPAWVTGAPTTLPGLVLRRLTTWDAEPGRPPVAAPDLATDTGRSSDGGRTWTYTLKPGLRYEDGTPITSADIKYGIERSFAPEVTRGLGYHKTLLVGGAGYRGPHTGAGLDSIETPDSRRIVFHLRVAYRDWPWIVATAPFTPVPRAKADLKNYRYRPVASGPYRIATSVPGSRVELVRNPHWDPATDPVRTAAPDRIVVELGRSEAEQFDRVTADTDAARDTIAVGMIPQDRLPRVAGDPDLRRRLVRSEPSFLSYLAINNRRGALQQLKVRQAIQYAVDKAAVAEAVGALTAAVPASTLIPPGMPGHVQYDLYPAGPSGDVATAKRLLAEAGHRVLRLTMRIFDDESTRTRAVLIQRALARAGIVVEIRKLGYDAWIAANRAGDADYDLKLSGWIPDYPGAASSLQPLYSSGSELTPTWYSRPDVDAAMERALAEPDPARAQAQWAALDRRIMKDAPVVPLIYQGILMLRGSNVRNFSITSAPAAIDLLRVSLDHG